MYVYRSVRSDVMNNYNSVKELVDLATEGLICVRALDFLQINNISDHRGIIMDFFLLSLLFFGNLLLPG
jgi:hypothetical protein